MLLFVQALTYALSGVCVMFARGSVNEAHTQPHALVCYSSKMNRMWCRAVRARNSICLSSSASVSFFFLLHRFLSYVFGMHVKFKD